MFTIYVSKELFIIYQIHQSLMSNAREILISWINKALVLQVTRACNDQIRDWCGRRIQ